MRDIKLRGISADEKVWIYGNLLVSQNPRHNFETLIIPQEKCNSYLKVNSSTVGQYTGLKDKNGVEIYEGDIVTDGTTNYTIAFYMGAWRLKRNVDGDTWWKSLYRYVIDRKLKVIGNIYENPEFLKENK